MPFDPKLILPDEPPLAADGEIALPDELNALADQLRDDAAHLAARYPAAPPVPEDGAFAREPQVPPRPSRESSRGRQAAAAGVAISASALVLLLGVTVARLFTGPVPEAARQQPTMPQAVIEQPLATSVDRPAPASPATISLAEASSPELEALLDLRQDEPGRRISISF